MTQLPEMTDLVAAIRAAIDETERVARATSQWTWAAGSIWFDAMRQLPLSVLGRADNVSLEDTAHMARHDPTRVLRRCAADRKILAWAQACDAWADHEATPPFGMPNTDDLLAALAEGYSIEVPA